MTTTKSKRRSRAEWQQIIDHYKESQLSGVEYCKRHAIGLKGFYRAKALCEGKPASKQFIRVQPSKPEWVLPEGAIRITFPHARIEIAGHVSANWVADVLKHTVQ